MNRCVHPYITMLISSICEQAIDVFCHRWSSHCFPYSVSIKESSVAKLGSVCRRIYRIFSHAYFHHRQIFDKYEVSKIIYVIHKHIHFIKQNIGSALKPTALPIYASFHNPEHQS